MTPIDAKLKQIETPTAQPCPNCTPQKRMVAAPLRKVKTLDERGRVVFVEKVGGITI